MPGKYPSMAVLQVRYSIPPLSAQAACLVDKHLCKKYSFSIEINNVQGVASIAHENNLAQLGRFASRT